MTYFSQLLKDDYPDLYAQITYALDKHNEPHSLLPETKDYWCRDYMPIPLSGGKYLQYRYFPNYLNNSKNRKFITDTSKVSSVLNLQCIISDIILDGGNVVRCGNKVVMVDKIFSENPHYTPSELVSALENLLQAEIVLLPWDRAEKYGHSDGVVRYLGNGSVVITNYKDYDPLMHERFCNVLSRHFQVKELGYTQANHKDSSWAYINFLQTERVIILPQLGIAKDAEAFAQISSYFPQYKGRIEVANAGVIIKEGGALNCISWNSKI